MLFIDSSYHPSHTIGRSNRIAVTWSHEHSWALLLSIPKCFAVPFFPSFSALSNTFETHCVWFFRCHLSFVDKTKQKERKPAIFKINYAINLYPLPAALISNASFEIGYWPAALRPYCATNGAKSRGKLQWCHTNSHGAARRPCDNKSLFSHGFAILIVFYGFSVKHDFVLIVAHPENRKMSTRSGRLLERIR